MVNGRMISVDRSGSTGIDFVNGEMSSKRFETRLIERVPPVVFEYNEKSRQELETKLFNVNS